MDTITDESNPLDLLSSVSIDSSSNSVKDRSVDDQSPVKIEDVDLLLKVNNLHCPFTWKPEESLRSYNCDSVEEIMNVDEIVAEVSAFKLRKFVIHLILCYNNFCKRLLDKSLRNIDDMEKMLLTSMKNRSQDVYFTQINDALFHILNSCRVVMFQITNQNEKAQQILPKIIPYEALSPTNQAGIWAVRANLYVEFGYEGIKAALWYIKKSTEIDDNNPYWHFTRGMYLGRLRRIESGFTLPSRDEIASLELAMKLKDDAAFMAFAAEVYVETVGRSKKKSQELLLYANENDRRNLTEKNNLISKRAVILFKKSVEMNHNCAHLLFRCGKGMLKLAQPYQDVRLAREYLKRGLEISYESSFGNHAMALYYMKHENNYDIAKKYLLKATESKNFGADIDLIRVNFLLSQDPEKLIDNLLKLFDRYQDKMKHRKILAEIISYYLFIDYNLTEVINYMNKLLYLIGDHDDIISVFKSGVLRQKFPISLLEILLSDIVDRSNKNTLNLDEQEECKKFMQRLCFQNVNLPRTKSENLRKKIIKEVKANLQEVKVSGVNRSPTLANEKHLHKEYNPAEGRFEKEYAYKYYTQEEQKRKQKTTVQEFFERYEAAAAITKVKSCGGDEKKSQDKDIHPILQKMFTKMKQSQKEDDSFNDLSEGDEELMSDIAKRLDFHLSISARSESKPKTAEGDPSTSHRSDDFNNANIHRRRSSRNLRKRSRSRDSYRSTGESYRKRSSSTESRYSTRHSHRRRSSSRESRRKRSPSVESDVSYRTKESSSKRRLKGKEDLKSSHGRSLSRESRYSVKSNLRRSKSRTRRDEKLPRRRRSKSRESARLSKITTHRKRSISRESRRSPILNHSRKKRSVSKEVSRRRSMSQESHQSSSRRKRSMSREGRQSSSCRERSMSRKNHQLSSRKARSMSRESRQTKTEHPRRKRSISKESYESDEEHRRKRSTSRDTYRSSKVKNYTRERSISTESHRSNKEPCQRSNIQENSKLIKHNLPALDSSDCKIILADSEKPVLSRDRSCSQESQRSHTRSSHTECKNRSDKSKKAESDHNLTEFSDNEFDYERSKSKKSYRSDRYCKDHRDYHKKTRPKSYSSDETRSIRSRRSSSKESRRSKKISSRDRRDDYRQKQNDRKYRKYSSSQGSSSYSSSESSFEEVDPLPKSSRCRRSSRDEDFKMKDRSKKDSEKLENQVDDKISSNRSRSVEKQKDHIQDQE